MADYDPAECSNFLDACGKKYSVEQLFNMLIAQDSNGCPVIRTSAAASGGSGTDYELRTTSYKANTAGTGYSSGDFIKRVDVMDVTQTPAVLISTLWFNETTGLAIAAAPTQVNLDPYQAPIVINDGADAAMGAKADAVATTDTGTFSLISLFKRLLEKIGISSSSTNAPAAVRITNLSNVAQAIKATTGNLYGWNIHNPNTSDVYVKFYNAAFASVVVGTTVPVLTLHVPPGSVYESPICIQQNFDTAISVAVVTTLADAGATAPASNIHLNVKYK
ncbi:MAG: hypothetical protein M3R27_05850 [Bacteroidota bacterium]|nr:hypothetical protein [Bacteroidota bacterium]